MSDEVQTIPPPVAVYIPEAQKSLRKGRTSIIEAVADGKLVAIKDGRRTKITVASIEAYNAELLAQPPVVFKRRIRKPRTVEASRTRHERRRSRRRA
jgi:hypothetical protein